jgi:hypothetical protein
MPWTAEIPTDTFDRRVGKVAQESSVLPTTKPWWDRNLIQASVMRIYRPRTSATSHFQRSDLLSYVSKPHGDGSVFTIPLRPFPPEFERRVGTRARRCGNSTGSRLWKRVYIVRTVFSTLMVTDRLRFDIAEHIVNVPEMLFQRIGDILRGKDFIRQVLTKKLVSETPIE